jgi:pimeloyl-ACP methyl ester carboxylesterase
MAAQPYETELLSLQKAVNTLEHWVPQMQYSDEQKKRFLANDKEALLASISMKRPDVSEAVIKLEVPCLFIAGTKDVLYSRVKKAASLSGNCSFLKLQDCTHGDTIYRSELVLPAVIDFLKKAGAE